MIINITNTPANFADYSVNKSNKISFKGQRTRNAVKLVFDTLAKGKGPNGARVYLGTTKDNVNISIREVSLSKKVELVFSNLRNKAESFIYFNIDRTQSERKQISQFSDGVFKEHPAKMILRYLNNLRS